jgi:hypothetical protein
MHPSSLYFWIGAIVISCVGVLFSVIVNRLASSKKVLELERRKSEWEAADFIVMNCVGPNEKDRIRHHYLSSHHKRNQIDFPGGDHKLGQTLHWYQILNFTEFFSGNQALSKWDKSEAYSPSG